MNTKFRYWLLIASILIGLSACLNAPKQKIYADKKSI
jgi:hypothetical protein